MDNADEKKVEDRMDRIKNWLKNPENMLLVAILVFSFALRMYYFFITKNQALWWDEGEYMMRAKGIALGTPSTGWDINRSPLFPVIAAIFFKIGLGVLSIKFMFILMSVGEIYMVYLLGKYLFNKRVGLIAALIFSVFYIDLFYTSRLLLDMPQVFFTLLGATIFCKYFFDNGSRKLIYFVLPVLFFGALVRFTVGLFIGILFLFLILTEGIGLFKQKEWYISALIGFAVFAPYMIYSYVNYGSLFQGLTGVANAVRAAGDTPLHVFMTYIKYMPSYVHWILFIGCLAGLIFVVSSLVLRYDIINKEKKTRAELFILIWVAVIIIYFGFFIQHFEDRYIFMAFPAIFLMAGIAFDKLYIFTNKFNKVIAVILLIAILIFGAYINVNDTTNLIKAKSTDFSQLQLAGLWIKENSLPGESVVDSSVPVNEFYSERTTYFFPDNESDFAGLINKNKPKYLVISVWDRSPEWAYNWPVLNNQSVTPVQAYYLDSQSKQIALVIYQFNYKNTILPTLNNSI